VSSPADGGPTAGGVPRRDDDDDDDELCIAMVIPTPSVSPSPPVGDFVAANSV